MIRILLTVATFIALTACAAGPQVARVQALSETADAPYNKILVISLFDSFDMRRYFEQEVIRQLSEQGVAAVASTSMMDTKTPVTRETFLAMVEELGSDAVLVTRLVSLNTKTKVKDANPESTHKVSPTYYYNVFEVELMEFVGPQDLQLNHTLVLSTQMYSADQQVPIWAIESNTKLSSDHNTRGDTAFIADEAKAIISYLSRDGLLAL